MGSPKISTILLSFALVLLTSHVSAFRAVLGIDVGHNFIKAALVNPGIPLEIVLTKDTQRKEVSAVGFKPVDQYDDDNFIFAERVFGADAINLSGRFPNDVYPNLKLLLGKLATSDSASTYSARYPAVQIVPTPPQNTIGFKSASSKSSTFRVEELLAMQLDAVITQAQSMTGNGAVKIKDVMFTIPAYFLAEERHALTLAAELAGLNVMGFVTDGLAVGTTYATSRTFDEQVPEYHIVYDMGAGSTTASLLKFQGKTVKDVGRFNKSVQEVSVLGVGYDSTLGGDLFNEKMFNILLADFIQNPKTQKVIGGQSPEEIVRRNGRAASKLWREATRTRQILSANTETFAAVESLYEDLDFRSGKITRATFEEAIEEFGTRITNPVYDALANAKVSLDQINSIIIHGGGTRTPFVSKKLEEIIGSPEKISRNVNTDEAAVLGATFKGAGESRSFRVKDIRLHDINIYEVSVTYKKTPDTGKKTKQVFPAGSPLETVKLVTFPHKQDFGFSLIHNIPGLGTEALSSIRATNVTENIKKLQESFGCAEEAFFNKITFTLNGKDGLPVVKAAWSECEVEIVEPEKKEGIVEGVKGLFRFGKKKDGKESKDSEEPEGDGEPDSNKSEEARESKSNEKPMEGGESEKDEQSKEDGDPEDEEPRDTESSNHSGSKPEADIPKIVRKIERIDLAFTVTRDGVGPLSAQAKENILEQLASFQKSDEDRRKLEEARNHLESYTYKAREFFSDDLFVAASTKEERAGFQKLIDETGEWLDGDGMDAEIIEVKMKHRALQDLESPIKYRREQNLERPKHIKMLRDAIEQTKSITKMLKEQMDKDAADDSEETTDDKDDMAEDGQVEGETKDGEVKGDEAKDDEAKGDEAKGDEAKGDEASGEETKDKKVGKDKTKLGPMYTPEDIATLTKAYEDVEEWLDEAIAKQEKLNPYDSPMLNNLELEAKAKDMNEIVMKMLQEKMMSRSKPEPESEPDKEKTKEEAKDENEEKADTDGESGEDAGAKKEEADIEKAEDSENAKLEDGHDEL